LQIIVFQLLRVIEMLPYNVADTRYIFVNRRGIIDVTISSSIVVFTQLLHNCANIRTSR